MIKLDYSINQVPVFKDCLKDTSNYQDVSISIDDKPVNAQVINEYEMWIHIIFEVVDNEQDENLLAGLIYLNEGEHRITFSYLDVIKFEELAVVNTSQVKTSYI